jgi:hypothetical protein
MSTLDPEELLQLGLHASEHGDPGKAIGYLKQCLMLEPVLEHSKHATRPRGS